MNGKSLENYLATKQYVALAESGDDGRHCAVPLAELRGSESELTLPLRIDWSPRAGTTYNLTNESDLKMAYRAVLSEGTRADIVAFVNASLLVRIWPVLSMTLPSEVVASWDPLIPSARSDAGVFS